MKERKKMPIKGITTLKNNQIVSKRSRSTREKSSVSTLANLTSTINYGRIFVAFSFVLFISSFVYRIYVSSNFAMKNSELMQIQQQITDSRKELAALEYENSTLSSMVAIEERATNQGFIVMSQNLLALDITKSTQLASLSQR